MNINRHRPALSAVVAALALACLTAGSVATALPAGAHATASDAPPVSLMGPSFATDTKPATGTFTFRTANGILPTWEAADLRITGVSPGSAITEYRSTYTDVALPIVAGNGSANFAAGGFRITNVSNGNFVNCATPVIDTRARVIDCVTQGGINRQLFLINAIGSRTTTLGLNSETWLYRGMSLRVASTDMADFLNSALETNVFSPYVTFANGELSVTRTN